MNKFKIGDNVKCLVESSFSEYVKQGEVYIVIETDKNHIYIKETPHGLHHIRFELVKPLQHRHSKFIKAWADGAVIQYYNSKHEWVDVVDNHPNWSVHDRYRIKPDNIDIIKELKLKLESLIKDIQLLEG